MEKVLLAQEQARALKLAVADYGSDNVMNRHTGHWTGRLSPLNNIAPHELARSLYSSVGYEVEPEFKVGDWVVHENDECQNVVTKIIDIQYANNRVQFDSVSDWQNIKSIQSHATPEEIAEEKERRWWKEHDRDVWEIKQGDVLMATRRHVFEVTADPKSHEFGFYTGNDEFDFYIEECKNEKWKVICFAEDRKDVDHD